MLLGKVLAESAMREDKHVTWLPSYGAEVRGGTAHCMVILSDKQIGSPYVDRADTLIVMNAPSLDRFKSRLKNKGFLIINSSLADGSEAAPKGMHVFRYPFTDMAVRLGNIRVANMIALGFFIGHKRIVKAESVLDVIREIAPEDKKGLVEINRKALMEGAGLDG